MLHLGLTLKAPLYFANSTGVPLFTDYALVHVINEIFYSGISVLISRPIKPPSEVTRDPRCDLNHRLAVFEPLFGRKYRFQGGGSGQTMAKSRGSEFSLASDVKGLPFVSGPNDGSSHKPCSSICFLGEPQTRRVSVIGRTKHKPSSHHTGTGYFQHPTL